MCKRARGKGRSCWQQKRETKDGKARKGKGAETKTDVKRVKGKGLKNKDTQNSQKNRGLIELLLAKPSVYRDPVKYTCKLVNSTMNVTSFL